MCRIFTTRWLSWLIPLHAAFLAKYAYAYDSLNGTIDGPIMVYPDRPERSVLEKLLTGPAASLLTVLIGTSGLYNFVTASGKGEQKERQHLIGLICVLVVIAMVWYRFVVWNSHARDKH